jgi:hypothetical protein
LISGWEVFEASCQEGVTERVEVLNSQCTEDALLNSEESDKDVLRHRTEINNSGKDLWGCWTPQEARLCSWDTVADRITEDSVGALPSGHWAYARVLGEELCWEFKKTRITEDSESSARWALSKCIGCTGGTELLNVLWEERLRQEGIEKVCRQAQRERELFEFCHLKEESTEGFHWVAEYPEGLSRGCLSQKDSQEGIHFILHLREKKKTKSPKGSECLWSSEEIALWCVKTLQRRQKSKGILWGFESLGSGHVSRDHPHRGLGHRELEEEEEVVQSREVRGREAAKRREDREPSIWRGHATEIEEISRTRKFAEWKPKHWVLQVARTRGAREG